MPIVDSHCHVSRHWFEPVETLLGQMTRAGVDRAVLTCAVYNPTSRYEEECMARFPGKFSFVVALDAMSPTAVETVHRAATRGAAGVRIRAPELGTSTAGTLAVLRAAAEHGLAVSYMWPHDGQGNVPAFSELLSAVPTVKIVIEHLGPLRQAGKDDAGRRRQMVELARSAGAHMKIHGLAEFCTRKPDPFGGFPFVEPIPPYLAWAYEAFGPQRLLWGSDFPLVCGREGYENALRLTAGQFAHLPAHETEAIFGGNALRLFSGT